MTVAEIINAAKALPPEERQRVLLELQDHVDDDKSLTLSPEWMAEIQRRIADLDAHPEHTVSWEEVEKKALARIAAHVDR
jgi:putative addiction module component (TIGR02574 family)